jgi:23S rRNA pseudouridine1911/1915/1917 synthase
MPREGRLEHYLLHGDHYAHVVKAGEPHAKRALLTYSVVKQSVATSFVEIALETGRYHQIRAQLAAIGHPVVGDLKYGSKTPMVKGTIDLCHTRFSFPHPITQELLTFSL